jgi:integrase
MSKPIPSKKSPFWQYDFQVRGVRFHGSTGLADYRKAQSHITKLRENAIRDLAAGTIGAADEVTVDVGLGLWWDAVGGHKRNWKTDDYRLATLVAGLGPDKLISTLTLRDFDAYVAERRKARTVAARTHMAKGKLVVDSPGRVVRLSPASVNREVQLARRVFLWLAEEGRGYKVPSIKWGKLLLAEPKERVRELSAAEEVRLFAALGDDLRALVEFAMLSGQRRTELVDMKWTDVDFDLEEATVTPKGEAERRHTFPLSPRMVAILKALPRVEDVKHVFTYECADDLRVRSDAKVVRLKGKRYPFSKQGWTRKWRKALDEAGISNFRFHDLRHTAATRLLRSTGNLKLVQQLLDHSEIATTARYAHASKEDLRAGMLASERQESRNSPGQVAHLV